MLLTEQIKFDIKSHAKEQAPKECCGFVLNEERIYRAKNTSTEIGKFSIDPEDFLLASKLGKISAVYHSHPKEEEARFSEYDKFNSISHNLLYILYAMKDNSFSQFNPSFTGFNKYIGREFEIGKTDCWQLVKDFYETELDIHFREYYRDENYKSCLGELFASGMETSGFYFVDQLQKYDCLLFGKKTAFHIGVYLGNDLILHQPPNAYSRIESYTDKHKKITKHIIRHNELN